MDFDQSDWSGLDSCNHGLMNMGFSKYGAEARQSSGRHAS